MANKDIDSGEAGILLKTLMHSAAAYVTNPTLKNKLEQDTNIVKQRRFFMNQETLLLAKYSKKYNFFQLMFNNN